MKQESTPSSKIERLKLWFKSPVSKLSGDDAFVVLMVSMSLFERYVHALISEENGDASPKGFEKKSADILSIEENTFNKFWGMYRVGLQHYLQPKIFESKGVKYRWEISANFPSLPTLRQDAPDLIFIIINPWGWFERVFDLWERRPDLLDKLSEFPLAEVYERPL